MLEVQRIKMCDIKPETTTSLLLCPTCLSLGREMLPLRDAASAYVMLLAGVLAASTSNTNLRSTQVCWECHRVFFRIVNFQKQVLEANNLLQDPIHFIGHSDTKDQSMSSLSIVTKFGFDFNLEHQEHSDNDWDEEDLPSHFDFNVKHEIDSDIPELKPEIDDLESHLYATKNARRKIEEPENVKKKKKIIKECGGFETPVDAVKNQEEKGKKKKAISKRNLLVVTAEQLFSKSTVDKRKIVTVSMNEEDMLKGREEARKDKKFLEADYKCIPCIKGFVCAQALEKHQNNFHNEERGWTYQCDVCTMCFSTLETKNRHLKKHYDLHVCNTCGYRNRTLDKARKHYDAAHDPDKTYPCSDCDLVFKGQRQLRCHRDGVHRHNHKCDVCQKTFMTGWYLREHVRITHGGVTPVECAVCKKHFRGERSLTRHTKRHKAQDSGEVAYCADCDIHFSSKDTLRQHLKKSEKHVAPVQLKHPCSKCQKKFTTETDLKLHDRRYHLDYTCHICNKKLSSSLQLNRHVQYVHEKRELPRRHVCEVCGKAFTSGSQLRTHHVIHTGERPYSCGICNATFSQRSSMQTHKKLVHLKQPRNVRKKEIKA